MFPKNIRILIVDDVLSARLWGKNQLTKLGYNKFFEAENGQKAFEVLEDQLEKNQPIGLVLSDWKMPEMDGIELFQKMQRHDRLKKLPFIVISAEPDANEQISKVSPNIAGHLTKPIAPQVLKRKLEMVWEDYSESKVYLEIIES